MNDAQKNTLVHAISHFGVDPQIDKAIEEMGELITELSRRRLDRSRREDIAEEIADVIIMANQLRIIYGGQMVDEIVQQKLDRLESIINGAKNPPATEVAERNGRPRERKGAEDNG